MPGKRNATDVAAEKPQPFDHYATVAQPFEAEGSRDVEFQQSRHIVSIIVRHTI